LEDVKQHKSYDDAWTVLNGKVYNMTAYLPFHPGGEKEIMRCAGRDGTRLFSKFILLLPLQPVAPDIHSHGYVMDTQLNYFVYYSFFLDLTHKWVNYEYMLKECQVGFLVSDGSSSNKLRAQ
jgi:cytochrome b involved in lipid metabolism